MNLFPLQQIKYSSDIYVTDLSQLANYSCYL